MSDSLEYPDNYEGLTPYARLAARIDALARITYGPGEHVDHEVHESFEEADGRREFNQVHFSSFCAPDIGPFGVWNYHHGSHSVSVVWWGKENTQIFVVSDDRAERIMAGRQRLFGIPGDCSAPDSAGLCIALSPGDGKGAEYFDRVGREAALNTAIEYATYVLGHIAQLGDTSESSNE